MASSSRPAPARKHVLALFGPTASGKTAVAGALRRRLGAEVVSADSAALYQGLTVLTAAPGYPARLVGGTGLYFRAALSAMAIPPRGRREHWQSEVDRLGPEAAHLLLAERDPAAAARVHPNDRRRLVRALELAEAGHSLAPADNRLWTEDTRLPTTIVALDLPPAELDRRIEERTRAMAAAGAVEEARRAWAGPMSATARKILGLEEFATLPQDEAVEAVAKATKRLARYQRKWLRRLPRVTTLDANRPPEEIADAVVALGCAGERLPRHDRAADA